MRIIIVCNDSGTIPYKSIEYNVDPGVEAYALLNMLGSIDEPIETEAEKHVDGIINSMMECLEIWATHRG